MRPETIGDSEHYRKLKSKKSNSLPFLYPQETCLEQPLCMGCASSYAMLSWLLAYPWQSKSCPEFALRHFNNFSSAPTKKVRLAVSLIYIEKEILITAL